MAVDCIIHYAKKNQAPDPKWRDCPGKLILLSRGPGPRNALVLTEHGYVVVPRWNVKVKEPDKIENKKQD